MTQPTTNYAALLDQPLSAAPLVFIDLETTGLRPHQGDRVCEVALVRVGGGRPDLTLDRLVNPQRALSAQAFRINGILPEQLVGAPVFGDLADELLAALDGAVLVAHNAQFDLEFLRAELARVGRAPPPLPVLDTLLLARRLLPRQRSYSLAALTSALGGAPPAHRAMADVRALRLVFADLVERLAALDIRTVGGALRLARGFGPSAAEPAPPPLIEAALREGRLLRIVYASVSSPEPTERVVRPLELVCERGVLYLRGFCFLRDDLRSFAIEKILQVEAAS